MTDDTIMLLANQHGVWALSYGIRPGMFRHPEQPGPVARSDVFNARLLAFARGIEKQWLDERSELLRLLLLARGEIYPQEDCVPGGPCECENGALMRRIDAVLEVT